MTAKLNSQTIASTDDRPDAFTRLGQTFADHPTVIAMHAQIEQQRRDHEARIRQQARRDIAAATSGR